MTSSDVAEPSPAERFAAAAARRRYPHLDAFVDLETFVLDEFQIEACRAFERGESVLVCAPTGAGKTVVGEFAVYRALTLGTKCFYTTPIKALSNQKYADFAARFGADAVGLVTGDTAINPHAPVIVMTTEVLRNMLYAHSTDLDGLSAVVLDEIHYLANRFRGAVWEEVILQLPADVQLVGLSATVSNAEEFGDWIRSVRGTTAVVVDEVRPVPLWQHMVVGTRIHDLYAGPDRRRINPALNRAIAQVDGAWHRRPGRGGPRFRGGWRPAPRPVVVERLERADLLPAIVFVFSRAGCDAAVAQCIRSGIRLTDEAEAAEIARVVDRHTAGLPAGDLAALDYWQWRSAWERGIAAHHAGLLPAFKETVEELFVRGLVKVVFATETLSLGINMPARTVVLERLVKFDGESHAPVTPGEYTQLTGRAGRRGIDVEGHAVVVWSPEVEPQAVSGLASTRTFPLKSSFRPTYNMVVNLVDTIGRGPATRLLERSFAQFQIDRATVGLAAHVAEDEARLAEIVRESGCDRGDARQYAELVARLSAVEKSARHARRGEAGGAPAESAQQVHALRTAIRQHPVHACPDRDRHLDSARRGRTLETRMTKNRRRLDRDRHLMADALGRIAELLAARGYLDGEVATGSGRVLQRLWFEADLLAADCLQAGLWRGLSAPDLAAAVSGLVFESRRGTPVAARGLVAGRRAAAAAIEERWRAIRDVEQEFGIDPTRAPDFGFAEAIAAWTAGADLHAALATAAASGAELSAGDFVRWCRQVVDALEQLSRAAPPGAVPQAGRAVAAIRRGVVSLGGD